MAPHPPYSCLEDPVDRGAGRATVHGVVKRWTWLSAHARPSCNQPGNDCGTLSEPRAQQVWALGYKGS